MKERFKLAGLRLISIPYLVFCIITTIFFLFFFSIGTLILGFPCWLFTGNCKSWVPDWELGVPTIFEWEKFYDDIKERQKKLDSKLY